MLYTQNALLQCKVGFFILLLILKYVTILESSTYLVQHRICQLNPKFKFIRVFEIKIVKAPTKVFFPYSKKEEGIF